MPGVGRHSLQEWQPEGIGGGPGTVDESIVALTRCPAHRRGIPPVDGGGRSTQSQSLGIKNLLDLDAPCALGIDEVQSNGRNNFDGFYGSRAVRITQFYSAMT